MSDTTNRVLSIDEVMALEEGARVWVEIQKPSPYSANKSGVCERGISLRGWDVVRGVGGDCSLFWLSNPFYGDYFRVWSLPQPPTPEEIEANPWRKEGAKNA